MYNNNLCLCMQYWVVSLWSHICTIITSVCAVLGSVTVEPQDQTVLQGQIAGFECIAENALPRASVTWYRDSIPLVISEDPRYYVSDVTGTLFIREVNESDVGQYSCVCVNSAGSVSSGPASLMLVNSLPRK